MEFSSYPEVLYLQQLDSLRRRLGGLFHSHKGFHVILRDGLYFGDVKSLIQTAMKEFAIVDASIANKALFSRNVREEISKMLSSEHQYVTFEFAMDDKKSLGKVVIEM